MNICSLNQKGVWRDYSHRYGWGLLLQVFLTLLAVRVFTPCNFKWSYSENFTLLTHAACGRSLLFWDYTAIASPCHHKNKQLLAMLPTWQGTSSCQETCILCSWRTWLWHLLLWQGRFGQLVWRELGIHCASAPFIKPMTFQSAHFLQVRTLPSEHKSLITPKQQVLHQSHNLSTHHTPSLLQFRARNGIGDS